MSKIHVSSEYKTEKKRVLLFVFFATLPLVNIFVRNGEKKIGEISDGVLCEAAESLEDKCGITLRQFIDLICVLIGVRAPLDLGAVTLLPEIITECPKAFVVQTHSNRSN